MSIVLRQIRSGKKYKIFAVGDGKRCHLLEFLTTLLRNNQGEASKIAALLEKTADDGPPRNKEKCRYFKEEKLFELKTTGGVRVMAFWDADQVIICSHGFIKKSRKTPQKQLVKAVRIRADYFKAKQADQVVFE